jgi:hypothetical protein
MPGSLPWNLPSSVYVVSPPNLTPFKPGLPLQDRTTLTYRQSGEVHRTEHETYEEGRPNSHDKNTCLTCRVRADLDENMCGVEDGPLPRHSEYEDVFAEAGLSRPSYDDDNEGDTFETSCVGIQDIIITGEVHYLFLRRPSPC